jgi:hypothetical protein
MHPSVAITKPSAKPTAIATSQNWWVSDAE